MREPDTSSTVAFLRQPEAYAEAPRSVTTIETHMSWVFLTDTQVYKLKKPVRHDSLDFSTPDRRRRCCEDEIRLNRRLAPSVYLDVVAVTRNAAGTLALGGTGEPIDWLVRMQRLPGGAMLDAIIRSGRTTAEEASIRAAARHLAEFYRCAEPQPLSGLAHRETLTRGVRRDHRELSQPRFGLPRERVETLVHAQLRFLERCGELFDKRVDEGRVVEGHGDLRPEHICLHPRPAIIDCLEFAQPLRVVDPADELAFLSLECSRLGEERPGHWFLDVYRDVTGDRPPERLMAFYRVHRALRRALLAAWHLDDPAIRDPSQFAATARRYLQLVEPVPADAEPHASGC